jgi:uncharacterized protein YqeY
MPIFDTITRQMTAAMKARDEARLAALREIRAAFLFECKKDGRATLTDEEAVAVLRRLEKQRKESIEAFEGAGRPDRADAERAELAVIGEFLPKLADADQTARWVDEAIAASGASKPGDVGRVMGALMKAHRGDVDGVLAREIAARKLGG